MTKERIVAQLRKSGTKTFLKKRTKGTGGGARNYTYAIEIADCEGGPTYFSYILRGDVGSYTEDACGDVLPGTLSFVTDIQITYEDFELSGMVFNAVDSLGEWSYFFGTDDLTGNDEYLVVLAETYQQGEPPPWDVEYGALAVRTQP